MPQLIRVGELLQGGVMQPWARYSSALSALLNEAQNTGLVLDFTQDVAFRTGTRSAITGVSGFTYTRTGTAYDLAGTTSFGANVPRRTSAGLLVEAAATNLALWSQDFSNAVWTKEQLTPSNTIAPDGTNTAQLLTEASGAFSNFRAYQNVGLLTGAYTVSIYLKANGRDRVQIRKPDGLDGDWVRFDLTALTATDSGTGPTATSTITDVGNGWRRCRISVTAASAAATFVLVQLLNASNNRAYTGNGTSGVAVWGADLKADANLSSYIPTTTASASRGADAASITGLSFSGAHSVVALTGVKGAAGFEGVARLDDTTVANLTSINRNGANAVVNPYSGSVDQGVTSIGTWAATAQKFAARVNTNDARGATDGGLAAADTTVTLPVGTLSRLVIGASPAGANYLNGPIQLLAILPRALSDGELTGATA